MKQKKYECNEAKKNTSAMKHKEYECNEANHSYIHECNEAKVNRSAMKQKNTSAMKQIIHTASLDLADFPPEVSPWISFM